MRHWALKVGLLGIAIALVGVSPLAQRPPGQTAAPAGFDADRLQEIDTVVNGDNYGWNIMEGFHGFDPQNYDACAQPVLTSPPPTLTLPSVSP